MANQKNNNSQQVGFQAKGVRKYICKQCQETFSIGGTFPAGNTKCPRCSSPDLEELIACNIEVGPPPWDFACRHCQMIFSVKSPAGPDEVKMIRCPSCESKDVKWLALGNEACPPGG